jgi:hypothetical protein
MSQAFGLGTPHAVAGEPFMNQEHTETLLRFTGDWPTLPVFTANLGCCPKANMSQAFGLGTPHAANLGRCPRLTYLRPSALGDRTQSPVNRS